ncbi:MAG: MarR family winged helix-turn-helix transcriptional regulator [Candidatus Protistobacter heckmanni]|nr:MarR family winged helix-turn-helix transcriptional regulator [Candidatus Protistobacter heckmanni]
MARRRASAEEAAPLEARAAANAETRAVDHGILTVLVGYNLKRAYLHIIEQFHAKMSRHDLRPAEFSLLVVLGGNADMTPKLLAKALEIAPPNLVALTERMAKRGLIERQANPADRRSQVLALTAEGKKLLAKATKTAKDLELRATDVLSAKERAALMEMLRRIYLSGNPDET